MTTSATTETTGRSKRETIWRNTKILLGVVVGGFLLAHVGCTMSEIAAGKRVPRYVYTETRTELVFDGEKIVIEGVTECRRRPGRLSNGQSLGVPTPYYNCRPQWFAHPLETGGVLLVGTYAISDSWPPLFGIPDLSRHQIELKDRARAVMWVDDPQSPTRGESYQSIIYKEQPRARLRSINSEIISIEDRTYFPKPYDEPALEVPWLDSNTSDMALQSYYAILVPKKLWSLVPRLGNVLSNYTEPVLLNMGRLLSKDERRQLRKAAGFAPVYTRFKIKTDLAHPQSQAGQRFDQSARIVPLIQDGAGSYSLDRDQPKGVIYYYVSPRRNSVIIKIDGHTVEVPTNGLRSWLIYDPTTEELIALGPARGKWI